MSDTQPIIPTLEKKEEMTATAEKLYAIYDQARASYRAFVAQNKVPENARICSIEVPAETASDTKTND